MADDMETQPTIVTVLERINALGEQLHARIHMLNIEITERLDRIEGSVNMLHAKIDTLNEELLDVKAGQRILSRRVDNLESKAS